MNLLFAIDDNVVDQLLTTLHSIQVNTPNVPLDIYVIQKSKLKQTEKITTFCDKTDIEYHPVMIGDEFKDAPTTDRYPATIYYRLLAHKYLPKDLDRILYLDVDILVINNLLPLYELDFDGNMYAAASHAALANDVTDSINKLRLGNYEAESYYNSGVMLMNLPMIREQVHAEDIFNYIKANQLTLFLPDQDVLNGLYGHQFKKIPDEIYNYDARMSTIYQALGGGLWNLDWVIDHTVVLHFCGRDKPWRSEYRGRYSGLYKHYAHNTKLILNK
ncbi:glycosyltransferase [Companilactobacillus nodensis DSM 19682 = JCM 14932 = NBRC 107160]|uniref:Glycosyltransferase n=1 Tax=Companilactobacillus nodensis DSM 19682 = JCM 14932 = NBRC 107160 TaxID=1423775 RepID=A0A0R1K6S4_9LACO|nr:glycosyltransferase family 8 protein [Companilactobacillus nodensis]KRK79019.1 glycosyltransferase [Companilactobacillus nodensis DSM 19682 = JCM 14932 = NBRC 107160]